MKTDIEDLKDNYEEEEEIIKDKDFRKHALDLFLPLSKRMIYLCIFLEKEAEQFGEIISSITGMYSFSRTLALKTYIKEIACCKTIPVIYRLECAKHLQDEGYPIINELCHTLSFYSLPTPIRVESIFYIMKNLTFKEDGRYHFCNIINDIHIETLYRFKLIQRLEKDFKDEIFYFYANDSSKQFVESPHNYIYYRILCCQYILQKCEEHLHPYANEFLLHVASMPEIEEDIRADACDILLAYGTPENVENARMILFVLGGGERARRNLFKNSQNVHNQSIESSVETLIEYITTYIPKNIQPYTFEKTKEELEERIEKQDQYDKTILQQSIIRIVIDRALYGRLNLSLAGIITKLWTFIQDSIYREELEKRLMEELIDSNKKCSSGYVSRIVNTISGFGEVSLKISFEDQIISILETRLNQLIMTDKNCDTILDEMTLPVRFYDKRGTFLHFFRTNISKIREEMYDEFKSYISSEDYDLYFRKAIMHYEGLHD
jgi:hypothetical protein